MKKDEDNLLTKIYRKTEYKDGQTDGRMVEFVYKPPNILKDKLILMLYLQQFILYSNSNSFHLLFV